jgi:hypothetical protein
MVAFIWIAVLLVWVIGAPVASRKLYSDIRVRKIDGRYAQEARNNSYSTWKKSKEEILKEAKHGYARYDEGETLFTAVFLGLGWPLSLPTVILTRNSIDFIRSGAALSAREAEVERIKDKKRIKELEDELDRELGR